MSDSIKKYIVLSLHENLYAIDLSQTAEILNPQKVSPIPNCSPYFCGAMNFHNSIVAVMDLATILGVPPVPRHDKMILLDPCIAALAFLVERVVRIINHDENIFSASCNEPFIKGRFALPDGNCSLLDIEALIRFASDNV